MYSCARLINCLRKNVELNHSNENEKFEEASVSGNLMDSRRSQLDDVLNEKLEQAFHKPTSQFMLHDIAKIASEHDPIDLAYAVTRLPPNARVVVYENLPDLNAKIIFIINVGSTTRTSIFSQINDQEIKRLLERMPPDEATWLLDDMSNRRMKRVLDLLEPKKAMRIRELYKHERNSAGRMMTNEFFSFHMNTTIGEVAAVIRNNPGIDLTRRIFVLADDEELVGFVPARNLIVNPPYIPIRQVMRPILHQINVEDSRDEAVDIVERYKISALPVVDEQNHLLGVITYENVLEALKDIADETIASFAGTAEDFSEHEPIFKRFLWRAPWLIVTLCAGLVTATALSHFKDRNWFTFVALFVPLIAGMSGNVGIQCSTILVRGMSTGELSHGSRREAILEELCIGVLIGIIFGLVCGVFVYLLNRFDVHYAGSSPLVLGAIVSCGLLGACLMATLLGSLSPFFFARFRIDPAVASGPIVTAFNDVLSTLMYIFIAKMISTFFLPTM
ncbi:Magnesium transporter MgtE [Candidatus Protochlamydia amoebophila]|nr:Magnesium transporter MgtE [Candidatus Protochlamydia amoebophila]